MALPFGIIDGIHAARITGTPSQISPKTLTMAPIPEVRTRVKLEKKAKQEEDQLGFSWRDKEGTTQTNEDALVVILRISDFDVK